MPGSENKIILQFGMNIKKKMYKGQDIIKIQQYKNTVCILNKADPKYVGYSKKQFNSF